nr:MAG TPA: hypothetical protein [Caudoviricetes sp.]
MTQFEQDQLFRAYCAQAELLRRELINNDIELQAARQTANHTHKELLDLFHRRAEIEPKLHELRTEHMARHAQPGKK